MVALAVAGSASADPLGFQGSLSIEIVTGFPPLVVSTSGMAQVTDDGSFHLVSLVVPRDAFGPTSVVLPVPGTGVSSIRLTLTRNLSR